MQRLRYDPGQFIDDDNRLIELLFKLYPWEWMLREAFGASLPGSATQFVEPPWILFNKGILPLLWEMYPNHPNLLPAYFDDDPKAGTLGTSYARKPLYSREGANIELIRDGRPIDKDDGPYGAEGYLRQAIAPLPQFDGNYTVLGSWFAAGAPCGLSVREDTGPITKNTSRFLPHAIIGSKLTAPAVGRDTLIGHPDVLRQLSSLPKYVDRHATARIPIAADAQPFGLEQSNEFFADGNGAILVEGAVVTEAVEIEFE